MMGKWFIVFLIAINVAITMYTDFNHWTKINAVGSSIGVFVSWVVAQ